MNLRRRDVRGLSLIELMIALVIGAVLTLGLLRVFAASREASRMAEGISRVQENGRFAMDFLQRDMRMVGHQGCSNDQTRLLNNGGARIPSAFPVALGALNFSEGIRGYGANATAPGGTITVSSTRPTGAWTGGAGQQLPTYISGLNPAPLPGSDVVEMRYFSAVSVPVVAVSGNGSQNVTITVDKSQWDAVMLTEGYTAGNLGLLGISDCRNAFTFQASSAPNASGNITIVGNRGLNGALPATGVPFMPGLSTLYRAESVVYYVGWAAGRTQPSLYRARFVAAPGGAALTQITGTATTSEELVEGVENMQMLYGTDMEANINVAPTGYIAHQNVSTATTAWPRVGLVQIALLSRSNERASSEQLPTLSLLGSRVALPPDGNYRAVYDSTVALRNRLFGK